MDIKDKVIIVTGGGRGIGRAMAEHFSAQGGDVAVFDLNQTDLDETCARCAARGVTARGYLVNVTSEESVIAGMDAVLRDFGRLDVLVNNAGITKDTPFHKMTKEHWDAVIGTNLNGLFNVTRPVWDGMRTRKFGRIINISSINGQKGQFGQVNYSASKAGDIGFTKALAQEGARAGITVNAICPGYIATEMVKAVPQDVLEKSILPQIPVGRLGEPSEIARAVVFLASDDAGFITGSTLTANGGQYLA